MSSLTLMRHGQASFGAASYDALSEVGVAQARATGAWLHERGQRWTAVLHGPRRRQADTARHLLAAADPAAPLQLAPGLDEFAEGEEVLAAAAALFGRPMTGPEAPERAEQLRCYEAAYQAWSRGEAAIAPRVSCAEFRLAARTWLHEIIAPPDVPKSQRILAVTSAGVIAAIVCEVLDLADAQWAQLVRVIHNASLTEVVFSKGRCGLRSFNGTGHLPRQLMSSI